MLITAAEPYGNVRVEQNGFRQCSISRPVSASVNSSKTGCVRSTLAHLYRAAEPPEQRSLTHVLIPQAPHRQSDRFGFVPAGEFLGHRLDQGDDVRTIDGDDGGHDGLQSLRA
jgi:hypothetical protein